MQALPVRVALFGNNGHQIQRNLLDPSAAKVVAIAGGVSLDSLPPRQQAGVRQCASLDELIADPAVDLISLCSPRRADQAKHAMRCLEAGKNVYAEKPTALLEADLDAVIAAAKSTGCRYHEQADTVFGVPYRRLSEIVTSGVIGEVVQVFAQKAYPWHDKRIQDEQIDGGILLQAGIYCARFVEHVAGARIVDIDARESRIGNPDPYGGCRRAVAMTMGLANGGLAAATVNYFCPPAPTTWPRWGYETVRVWGMNGMAESIDNGRIGTLAINGRPLEQVDLLTPPPADGDLLSMFIKEIRTGQDVVPMSLERELSPTRWVIRAKANAKSCDPAKSGREGVSLHCLRADYDGLEEREEECL